jgi:lysophospholipase L1-like esterase
MKRRLFNAARVTSIALLLLAPVYGRVPENRAGQAKALRVLFIGNSLTYWNDLPELVEALAAASGAARPTCKAIVAGGYSLEDHWQQGAAQETIAQGGWDVVVLQQGPSASAEGRASLLEYARRFAGLIRRAGAKPALYMVWPATDRKGDFDGVAESYRLAAEGTKGLLFPAGEAWRAAWRRDPKLALYSPDGLHPTPAGTYLAALTIYGQLYARTPEGLPASFKLRGGTKLDIPLEQAKLLQEAAAEANQKFGRR